MQTKTALVVDDSRVARMTLGKQLRNHGFEVVEQNSAEAALQWLQASTSLPDLIFMDVMMEGMDGFTATQRIKAEVDWRDLPVVICSGKETEADLEQARASGAKAVLAKPPEPAALEAILNEVLVARVPEPVSDLSEDSSAAGLAETRAQIESELTQKLDDWCQQFEQQQAARLTKISTEILSKLEPQLDEITGQQVDALSRQLTAEITQQLADAVQHTEASIDLSGLEAELTAMLKDESQRWLQQQQAQLQMALQQSIEPSLQQQVRTWVSEQVAQQSEAEHEKADLVQKLASLQSQLSLQRNIMIGTALLALLALGLALF